MSPSSNNHKKRNKKHHYPPCDKKRCKERGTLFPVLVMPFPKWTKGSEGEQKMESEMTLNVCTTHADENKIDWFVDDQGWSDIIQTLAIRGLPIPERKDIYIKFKPLEDRRILQ